MAFGKYKIGFTTKMTNMIHEVKIHVIFHFSCQSYLIPYIDANWFKKDFQFIFVLCVYRKLNLIKNGCIWSTHIHTRILNGYFETVNYEKFHLEFNRLFNSMLRTFSAYMKFVVCGIWVVAEYNWNLMEMDVTQSNNNKPNKRKRKKNHRKNGVLFAVAKRTSSHVLLNRATNIHIYMYYVHIILMEEYRDPLV